MDGSDSSFGSSGNQPISADPPDAEHDSPMLTDGHDGGGAGDEAGDPFASSANDVGEIPRHTKPFRAWGAAYEPRDRGPSLWARFRAWLAGMFRRKQTDESESSEFDFDASESRGLESAAVDERAADGVDAEVDRDGATATAEPDEAPPSERISYDNFDAPWSDPPSGTDVVARRSGELPSPKDFEAPWDDPFAGAESQTNVDELTSSEAPAVSPVDPVWDEPRVTAPANAPAQAIDRADLDFVWTPPTPSADELLSESKPHEDVRAEPARPKRMSFISRLFSRKKKEEAATAAAESDSLGGQSRDALESPAAQEPTVDDFAEATASAEQEPTVDDFAEATATIDAAGSAATFDAAESTATIDAAEAPIAIPRSPSLEHSADDAAELADLLAAPYVPPERPTFDAQMETVPTEAAAEQSLDEIVIEPASEDPVEAMFAGSPSTLAESATDAVPGVDAEPDTEIAEPAIDAASGFVAEADVVGESEVVAESAEAIAGAEPETVAEALPAGPPKKLGFFSRLVWRLSQARPPIRESREVPAVAEPLDETVAETQDEVAPELSEFAPQAMESNAEEALEASAAPVEEAPAEEAPAEEAPAEESADYARWAPPAAEPTAEQTRDALASTQPFAPFRDARDDLHEEVVVEAAGESGRITEAVEQPAVDEFAEGEKTDEFEVVPGAPGTAEEPAEPAEEAAKPGLLGRLFGRKMEETTQPVPVVERPGGTVAETAKDAEGKAPFVLAKFRMFYNEIIRDKHQKSDVISGFATAIVSAAAADMADPEFASQLLAKRLSEMLELQAAESTWTGGDAAKYYPEAQYAMVCLADETFSVIDWPGRPSWHKYKLEPRMYGTRAADTELFRRIDKLLREPNPPKGARDLARVYLMVIASGFRGLFREPNLKRPLAEYRRRLYEFSHEADPLELYGRDRKIFPEVAAHTLAGRAVGRFTAAQKWIAAVVVLVVAYLAISQFAWVKLSADLKDVMSRIETSTGPGGAAR